MAQIMLRDYLQETEDAISSDRIDDALTKCQQVLAHFPESLEAQRLLGEVHLAQGHLEDAQHAFDWVLTNDPENVIAYCNRALVSERKADFDTALDCYQQAYELSRGNSQIRNEFNKLCAKVGQQGFMLSRAGLARLYMRGDLLTQAVQEWDVVLVMNPDRLDARTGLLETLWRDGLYERAEMVASQILQDVPGCLKALLLSAYMVSARDIRRAQELLERAEALDPDLLMAQELFSDTMAKQPAEPFLQLLKKAPASVDAINQAIPDAPTAIINDSAGFSNGSFDLSKLPEVYDLPTSMNTVPSWGGGERWGHEIPLMAPTHDTPKQDALGLPVWASNSNIFGADTQQSGQELSDAMASLSNTPNPTHAASASPWDAFGQDAASSDLYDSSQLEQWQMPSQGDLLTTQNNQQPKEPELWDKLDKLSADLEGIDIWESKKSSSDPTISAANLWNDATVQEGETPSPPAWLSMLTQGERRQLNGSATSLSADDSLSSLANTPASSSPSMDVLAAQNTWQDELEEEKFAPLQTNWQDELEAAQPLQPPFDGQKLWQDELEEEQSAPLQASWQNELKASQSAYGSQASWQDELKANQPAYGSQADLQMAHPAFSSQTNQQEELKAKPSAFASQEKWQKEIQEPEQTAFSLPPWQDDLDTSEDEDEHGKGDTSFFGPAWLKSLGAALIDHEDKADDLAASSMVPPQPVAPAQSVVSSQTVVPPQSVTPGHPAITTSAVSPPAYEAKPPQKVVHETALEMAYEAVSDPTAKAPEKVEWGLHMTLEELEQSLIAQGFLHLEPNSLSTIAKAQDTEIVAPTDPPIEEEKKDLEVLATPPLPTAGLKADAPQVRRQEIYQEPTLSSALAELGNFTQSPTPQTKPSTVPATPLSPIEPLWAAMPQAATPQNASAQQKPSVWGDLPANPLTEQKAAMPQKTVQRNPVPDPVFQPTRQQEISQSASAPLARPNPLLESELETTMKRPAVRLQAMQHPVAPREPVAPSINAGPNPVKARPVERMPASKTADGNTSAQARLLKGYQYQLAGDYDGSMREYRIVIKSAPELLGEIVSNVRALLKLAPNYSAGYRVLGDAYMRQGEYLQAMEAYNKALTMAKKARS